MMNDTANQHPAPPPARRRGWQMAALLLIALTLSAGAWLFASTAGLRWAAAALVHASAGSVSIEGVGGTLLGPMDAKTLVIDSKDLRITARDIRLDWQPAALLRGKLGINTLTARDVEMLSLPSPAPESLCLPLPLSLHKLEIGTLRVITEKDGASAFSASNLAASLESDGRLHRLQGLRASLDYGKLAASGQMSGVKPFTLQVQADLAGLSSFTGTAAKDAHLSATLSGNLTQLTIKAKGNGAGLTGTGEAQLTPYAAFPVATLRLQASGLNPHTFSPTAPKADLTLQADLRGNAAGRLEGDVTVKNASPAPLDRDGLPLLEARAHATLSADLLQFDNLVLALAHDASISGHFAWQREQSTGSADLIISRLNPAALDTRLRPARLSGGMKLSGDITAQQGVLSLGDGMLRLDAHLARTGDTLTLGKLRLTRGRAALTGEGKLQLGGQQAYAFNGRLQHFDLAEFVLAPHSDLNATLNLTGALKPQAAGTVSFMISDSRLANQPVSGSGQIGFAGISSGKGEAELRLGDNRLSAKGSLGSAADRLQLELTAPALGQLGPGFGGTFNAHAILGGSLAKPYATLKAEGRNLALPGDHHLSSIATVADLNGEALTLKINAAGYKTKEKFSSSAELKTYLQSLQFTVQGSRSHHELETEALLGNDNKLTLRANGGLSDPAKGWGNMQWQGMLTELSGAGVLPFKLLADTPLSLGRDHASLGTAAFALAGGQIRISSAAWTPQQWSSRGNFSGIGLRAGNKLQPGFIATNEQGALRLGGEWDIVSAAQLTGSLRVARESGDWVLPGDQPLPLGLQTVQFTARTANGRLSGELSASGERLGDWRASVAMPLAQSGAFWAVPADAPLTGQIRVNVPDLAWVGPAIHSNLKSAGRLALEADVTGIFGAPRLHGQVRGDDLALVFLDQGVRLQQGQFAARLDKQSLHIDTLSFIAPHEPQPRDRLLIGVKLAHEPGKLTASGTINLNGERSNLEINATRLPLAQRPDRWIIASGNGQASFSNNTLALVGNIIADAGLISQPVNDRPQLSDDIVFSGQQPIVRKGPRISVDAKLDLGKHFYLRASGLEARLAGQLSLREVPGQKLRAIGTIIASNASFEAYGQHLTVERGIVNFQGPLSDPGLNILALRKGPSVEAGVEVTGTALRPTVRLVSTPVVPDSEKLSWIVLGRLPNTSGIDSAMLLTAAGSILGGQSGGITEQLKQTLGIDELSLQHSETEQAVDENPLSNQIVIVGKRLSTRAFLSYEQGVTGIAGVTKLTYTLTPRVNIVTQAGVDNAIDIFYTFSFN